MTPTPHQLEVGNKRLLKLAEYLEKLPRGSYNQENINDSEGGKCACAHTWDMPQYKRWRVKQPNWQDGVTEYYHLRIAGFGSNWCDWIRLFGSDGCQQKDGRPARTGKQAAKFIRQFVSERREPK